MQRKKQLDKLSRLRQTLREHLADLEKSLEVAFGRAPMVKGNVYELARKCGKPTCACTRGELHRSMVLTWSHEGKSKLFSIPPERLSDSAGEERGVSEVSSGARPGDGDM